MSFVITAISESGNIVRICESPEAALEQGSAFLVLLGGDVSIEIDEEGTCLTLEEFRARHLNFGTI